MAEHNGKITGGWRGKYNGYVDRDEYYTTPLQVRQVFAILGDRVRGRKIWFPCDAEWSEFVVFAKKNAEKLGFEWRASSCDFRELLHFGWCDLVISNPPFSFDTDFLKAFKDKDFCKIHLMAKANTAVRYMGDRVRGVLIDDRFYRRGRLKRVGGTVALNTFGLHSPRRIRHNAGSYQTNIHDGLPIYNRYGDIPNASLAPARFYAPCTSLCFLGGDFMVLGIGPSRKVEANGRYKFARILWQNMLKIRKE